MSLVTNVEHVGALAALFRGVRTPPQFMGQKFTPRSMVWDNELQEWVSFYWVDQQFRSSSFGAQCMWLDNNAEIDNSDHFGIKLTDRRVGSDSVAKISAYAMYQRQKLAADNGLAPPVHGMCCFKYYNKAAQELCIWWGYLSCVADTNSLEYSSDAEEAWNNLCEQYKSVQYKLDDVDDILRDAGVSRSLREKINDWVVDDVGVINPDTVSKHEWIQERSDEGEFELYDGFDDLQNCLNDLDISHLQNDWKTFGTGFAEGTTMGGDLHAGNIGYWQGDLVAIDFGFHCVSNY